MKMKCKPNRQTDQTKDSRKANSIVSFFVVGIPNHQDHPYL